MLYTPRQLKTCQLKDLDCLDLRWRERKRLLCLLLLGELAH